MTALPPSSDFSGGTVTQGGFKTAVNNLRDYLNGLLGTDGTVAAARNALGLGTAATKNTGTSTGTVPLWETLPLNSVAAKTAAYTVVAADRGKVFDCDGTFTLTLTAAATLGDGFVFGVRNSGTGTVTIDPDVAELIDGVATITFAAGASGFVACNGTAFKTLGKAGPVADGSITAAKLDGSPPAGPPIYAPRAWVNFNGTGTVAIRAQGNVGSITDNGVGDYTVNFTTAMPDANYAATVGGSNVANGNAYLTLREYSTGTPINTTHVNVKGVNGANAAADMDTATVAVFR